MRLTILNFAQRHIKTANCCVHALKALISIFDFGKIGLHVGQEGPYCKLNLHLNFPEEHVSTTNFELSELKHSLMEILTAKDFEPPVVSVRSTTFL